MVCLKLALVGVVGCLCSYLTAAVLGVTSFVGVFTLTDRPYSATWFLTESVWTVSLWNLTMRLALLLMLSMLTMRSVRLPVEMLGVRWFLMRMVSACGPCPSRYRAVSMRVILAALTLKVSVLKVLRAEARSLL